MTNTYLINEKFVGRTIKEYLEHFYLGSSKIYKLFQEKKVMINDNYINENYVLKLNDVIVINFAEERDFLPDCKKLDIVYEDDYFLFVNKPTNVIVHPDDKAKNGTMCNRVSYYYQNKGIDYTIKYAHRLDTDTTGILMFAKDELSSAYLHHIIATHELKRTYLCLAGGRFKNKKGRIDLPIGKDRHHNQRRRISKTGQMAITNYEVIKEYKDYSLVKVLLETGRTHQIRVHLAHLGHPLLGDALYFGSLKYKRVMLHSYQVEFVHPVSNELIVVKKDLPFDMRKLLE